MRQFTLRLNTHVFNLEISHSKEGENVCNPTTQQRLYPRFLQYIEDSHRDGIMGHYRYSQMLSKARKLKRFLIIKGVSNLHVNQFDINMLLDFRQFIFDEYLYVPSYPNLYPRGIGKRPPVKRCKNNTVVHDLKALSAFFNELENREEIQRSPFRKLAAKKQKSIMHVMFDEPFYLHADEVRRIINTPVPEKLQTTKDIFILNCAIGCRLGDLQRLTMSKVAVSSEGIPFIHYIPSKTASSQSTNREIQTPLIHTAWEIIQRTQLLFGNFNAPKLSLYRAGYERQKYNHALRRLLYFCGINRRVSVFDQTLGDNRYVPLCQVASSRLARKTHIDMLNKVQINYYAAGLHCYGSDAVFRYTSLELSDHFALLNAAFAEKPYHLHPSSPTTPSSPTHSIAPNSTPTHSIASNSSPTHSTPSNSTPPVPSHSSPAPSVPSHSTHSVPSHSTPTRTIYTHSSGSPSSAFVSSHSLISSPVSPLHSSYKSTP